MAFPEYEFKKGDKVRLISGGPDMVVQDIAGNIISCRWVRQAGKVSKIFASVLEKVRPQTYKKGFEKQGI